MKNLIVFLVATSIILNACDADKNDVICTEIFALVTIDVTGGDLDEHFTIRISINDTIRPNQYTLNNSYTVLDDNYLPELRNSEDKFTFVGLIDKHVVISEEFVIKADECHIAKVSGADTINL